MKISLALGPRQALSRQTAWGCLTTNLTLPGFGSLVAGCRSGYFQATLAIGGLILTTLFGIRFILWAGANWSSLQRNDGDPFEALIKMWLAMRWAVLGIGLFAMGWLWALITSLRLLREARQAEQRPAPPRL
jgi:hypothetical protein